MRATPQFDFQLGESVEMIREATARFADERIAPLAEKSVVSPINPEAIHHAHRVQFQDRQQYVSNLF